MNARAHQQLLSQNGTGRPGGNGATAALLTERPFTAETVKLRSLRQPIEDAQRKISTARANGLLTLSCFQHNSLHAHSGCWCANRGCEPARRWPHQRKRYQCAV